MSLIKIENLSFSYYGYLNDVFDDVSFSFDTNWKTGLIGRNGIGKSTFFKLLLAEEKYQGKINKSVECTKFPPDIEDETSSAIEFFNSYINNAEEWRFFKELNLLELDESLAYAPLNTLSKGERTKVLLAVLNHFISFEIIFFNNSASKVTIAVLSAFPPILKASAL